MTYALDLILPALPPTAVALALWRRARRAEARLAARDTRHRRLVTEMVRLAERDPLTGLANRRAFDRAMAELETSGESGALVVLDLDNFKQVNDRLGHQCGDEVLHDVARALRRRVRDSDLVARIGGDEFAVVLRTADTARAQMVAADLRATVRATCRQLPLSRPVDASFGIAALGGRGASRAGGATELMARADAAMYRAKRARRDRRQRRFGAPDQLELAGPEPRIRSLG